MSLEPYRRPRMVVLHPWSTAREAARAMMANHIGAVLVAEHAELVGIVTDRDLAVEVVAAGLDPHATLLHEIMSGEIAALDIGASVNDVVRTMREHACRRVPLTERGKPAGLVTLDDLLLEGAIDVQTAADVVRAQLEVAARYKREGAVHPESPARPGVVRRGDRAVARREARADASHAHVLRVVERYTGLGDREQLDAALDVVLSSLCRRVTRQEARHLIAQLPSRLQARLSASLDGPDRSIGIDTLIDGLASRLGIDAADAEGLMYRVCQAIADVLSEGQIDSLRGQLPLEMKDLFPAPQRRSA
jgi:CBS domain-containing protein/uncharacterized protein (DUF2267 family)